MSTALATRPTPASFVPDRPYTIEEWLAIEEASGEKYEYHEGRLLSVRAMAGGTAAHALITANAIFAAGSAVRARRSARSAAGEDLPDCDVYSSDLQLMIRAQARYVYPDAVIICGPPEYDGIVTTAARNPSVVLEVLSPSSVGYDTGDKFDYYATLPTLREYVLLAQDKRRMEVRSRAEGGGPWQVAIYTKADAEALLPSLDAGLALREVYRNVTFEG